MIEPRQLSAMMRLLDDPSSKVRDAVAEQLASLGADLEDAIHELPEPPGEDRVLMAQQLVEQYLAVGTTELDADLGEEEDEDGDDDDEEDDEDDEPESEPRFEVGQIVRHKRYGYRGVVVEADQKCRADEGWYTKNRTKPKRRQPWYHVLVHDSQHVTYAAESSLLPDESEDAIRHPLVPYFFKGQNAGRYQRNDRAWPGWKS